MKKGIVIALMIAVCSFAANTLYAGPHGHHMHHGHHHHHKHHGHHHAKVRTQTPSVNLPQSAPAGSK